MESTEVSTNETTTTIPTEYGHSNAFGVVVVVGYYLIINLISFFYMGVDKRRAVSEDVGNRISEAKLWLLGIVGGALGGFIAMLVFWHKIRTHAFSIGFSVLAIVQAFLLYVILKGVSSSVDT